MVSYEITSASYCEGCFEVNGYFYDYYWTGILKASIKNSVSATEWGIYNEDSEKYYSFKLVDGEISANWKFWSTYSPVYWTYYAYAKLENGDIIYSDPMTVITSYGKSGKGSIKNIERKSYCAPDKK